MHILNITVFCKEACFILTWVVAKLNLQFDAISSCFRVHVFQINCVKCMMSNVSDKYLNFECLSFLENETNIWQLQNPNFCITTFVSLSSGNNFSEITIYISCIQGQRLIISLASSSVRFLTLAILLSSPFSTLLSLKVYHLRQQ